MLTFDSKTHTYLLDGEKVPCVSDILKQEFETGEKFVNKHAWEYGCTRGKHVHHGCWLIDQGTIDPKTIDPAIKGYLTGWVKFKAQCKPIFDMEKAEKPMYSDLYRFAGTPDRTNTKMFNQHCIIDIKTSKTPSRIWGLQLSGYDLLAPKMCSRDRCVVQLFENGTYKLIQYKDPFDKVAFKAALTMYYWKKNNNLLKKEK